MSVTPARRSAGTNLVLVLGTLLVLGLDALLLDRPPLHRLPRWAVG